MPSQDFVTLEVNGNRFEDWISYLVDSDLLVPASVFSLKAKLAGGFDEASARERERLLRDLKPLNTCQLFVGLSVAAGLGSRARIRALQMTGIIDDVSIDVDLKGGTVITVEGRDVGAYLVDSSVPVGLIRETGTKFVDLVRAAVEPWGLEVLAESVEGVDILTGRTNEEAREDARRRRALDAGVARTLYSERARRIAREQNRPLDEVSAELAGQREQLEAAGGDPLLPFQASAVARARARLRYANGFTGSDVQRIKIREAKPRAGETVWSFLDRHARRLGLMLWMDPRGRVVVSSPNYSRRPLYRLVRRVINDTEDPNTILRGGRRLDGSARLSEVRVFGRARGNDAARSSVRGSATDSTVPFQRLAVIHDNALRESIEAASRARRELSKVKSFAEVLSYAVLGHGQGRHLYAVDTTATVIDEMTGASGTYYVRKRTFEKSRDLGTQTSLQLVPLGSMSL